MIEPVDNVFDIVGLAAWRHIRSLDHDHLKTEAARGGDLGKCTRTAGIFRNNDLRSVFGHERDIVLDREGAAVDHHRMAWQRRRRAGRIDETQQIVVLRLTREVRDVHPADGQKDPGSRTVQGSDGCRNVGNAGPAVAFAGGPGRAGQGDQRELRGRTGRHGVPAHILRKRVRGVHDMGYVRRAQIVPKAVESSEATDTRWQRLRSGALDPAGEGHHRVEPEFGKPSAKRPGFGRTAQNEDL